MPDAAPAPTRPSRRRLAPILVVSAVALAATAALLHVGLSKALFGPSGEEPFARAAAEARAEGYELVAGPETVGSFLGFEELDLRLEAGRCYALVVGAGRTIHRVDLRADERESTMPNAEAATLTHCPARPTRARAAVTLAGAGRYTWALFARQAREGR